LPCRISKTIHKNDLRILAFMIIKEKGVGTLEKMASFLVGNLILWECRWKKDRPHFSLERWGFLI
jgi:hypothetical protein